MSGFLIRPTMIGLPRAASSNAQPAPSDVYGIGQLRRWASFAITNEAYLPFIRPSFCRILTLNTIPILLARVSILTRMKGTIAALKGRL